MNPTRQELVKPVRQRRRRGKIGERKTKEEMRPTLSSASGCNNVCRVGVRGDIKVDVEAKSDS